MNHPLIPQRADEATPPEKDLAAPLLAALAETEQGLQAGIREGLSRDQFPIAHALRDALQACQEVVQACKAG